MEGSKEYITSFDFPNEKSSKNSKGSEINKKRAFKETDKDAEVPVGPDIKKKPKIELDEIILDNLPKAELYERSLMHRDIINHGKKYLII